MITKPPIPVSVLISVKNEEVNIGKCLAALGNAYAEIIVIDSGSTDTTQDIARQAGAHVIEFYWDGRFPKKRNWALRSVDLCTEWGAFSGCR